ncbi:hypothetical protein YC2023_033740 [Brassica napus]
MVIFDLKVAFRQLDLWPSLSKVGIGIGFGFGFKPDLLENNIITQIIYYVLWYGVWNKQVKTEENPDKDYDLRCQKDLPAVRDECISSTKKHMI